MAVTTQSKKLGLIQLKQLFLLRTITIVGIIAVIVFVHQILTITLPLTILVILIVALLFFNAIVWLRIKHGKQYTGDLEFFAQLCIDTIFFALLLYLTGGAANPFGLIFLIPIIISATVLPGVFTWVLASIAISCYSLLVFIYTPSHSMDMMHGDDGSFDLHVLGMWIGFVFGTLIVAFFVTRLGRQLDEQQTQLHLAHEQAIRDKQLIALGTLAASTAHEINTPLGSVALIAQEIFEETDSTQTREHISVIKQQVERCKQALSSLSSYAGELNVEGGRIQPVDQFLNLLITNWRERRPDAKLEFNIENSTPAPSILADDSLRHAINNVLDNAADVSPEKLTVTLNWDSDNISLATYDEGPGLGGEAIDSLGKKPYSNKQTGMGLGLFLAHAVVKRFDGQVSMHNRDSGGILTNIILPISKNL